MSGLSIRSTNCPFSNSSSLSTPAKRKEDSLALSSNNNKNLSNTIFNYESENDYTHISLTNEPMEMKPKVKNPLFMNKSLNEIPIPKGNTAYSKAKRAEYVERDLEKAEKYYKIAIKHDERLDSAIKDLATVLHQQGKTDEACKFLEEYRHLYRGDKVKYENLLINLRKQIVPSGNCLNRTLVLFDYPSYFDQTHIKAIFSNNSRILQVEFKSGMQPEDTPTSQNNIRSNNSKNVKGQFCLIYFASYSAARKTLETLKDPQTYQLYWMNIYGKIAGKAELTKSVSINVEENTSKTIQTNTKETQDINEFDKSDNTSNKPLPVTKKENENICIFEEPVNSRNPTIQNQGKQKFQISSTILDKELTRMSHKEKSQSCWNNFVILAPCHQINTEPPFSESKIDIHQEVILSYIIFKVFENEEKTCNNSYWRQLLRRSHSLNAYISSRTMCSLWEDITKKEDEIKLILANDSKFINKLLLLPSKHEVTKFQDFSFMSHSNSQLRELFNEESSEMLDFFPKLQDCMRTSHFCNN